tara:strand:+ start:1233 stop:1457 length:225 start_codon:yes stop_codon:yes gene_type:complete
MKGAKETAMVILGMGDGSKKDRHHHDESHDEEEMEYSDDQLMMAGELRSALDGGDEHDILTAIHGIMMSYKMDY